MPKLSNSFGGSAFGIPEKSKHSLLEYCSSWCWFLFQVLQFYFLSSGALLAKLSTCFPKCVFHLTTFHFVLPKDQTWKLYQVVSGLFLYFVLEDHAVIRECFLAMPKMMEWCFYYSFSSSCPLVRIFHAMIAPWLRRHDYNSFVTLITYVRSAWCSKRGLLLPWLKAQETVFPLIIKLAECLLGELLGQYHFD